jgi:hypothetical protein
MKTTTTAQFQIECCVSARGPEGLRQRAALRYALVWGCCTAAHKYSGRRDLVALSAIRALTELVCPEALPTVSRMISDTEDHVRELRALARHGEREDRERTIAELALLGVWA